MRKLLIMLNEVASGRWPAMPVLAVGIMLVLHALHVTLPMEG